MWRTDSSQGAHGTIATARKKPSLTRFLPLLLGTTVLALILAACGGNSAGNPPSGGSIPSTTPAQKPAEKAKSSSGEIDACSLVTKAEAEQALGVAVGQPERPPEASFSCRWTGQKGQGVAVLVVLVRTGTPSDMKIGFEVMKEEIEEFAELETVAGLGDQAYLLGDQVHVLRGGTYLVVNGDASPEALKSLAQKALSRLP